MRHDYFSHIDSFKKAYVVGLIAADGNILELHRRLTIELAARDSELIELARDEIAPGYSIRERQRRNRDYLIFSVTSASVVADLGRLGIGPRKSLTLEWPSQLSGGFARAFLLGYFDGDGIVTLSRSGRYVYGRWALLGTSAFLTAAMSVISAGTGIRARTVRRSKGRIHQLQIGGADSLLVDEWLHQDGLGLERKRLDRLLEGGSVRLQK